MSEKKGCMTWWEFGCAVVVLMILAAIFLPAFSPRRREVPRRASCQNNLKQFALVYRMYAGESKGNLYPPMTAKDVVFFDCDSDFESTNQHRGFRKRAGHGVVAAAPLVPSIYPEYISDPHVFLCPASGSEKRLFTRDNGEAYFDLYCAQPNRGAAVAGVDYAYNGFACYGGLFEGDVPDGELKMREPLQLSQLFSTIKDAAAKGDWAKAEQLANEDFPSDTPAKGAAEPKVYRLREGVEKFLISDVNNPQTLARAKSQIWVMHDRVFSDPKRYWHQPGGANVVYLDGHAEFQRFTNGPTDMPPADTATAQAYAVLDEITPH